MYWVTNWLRKCNKGNFYFYCGLYGNSLSHQADRHEKKKDTFIAVRHHIFMEFIISNCIEFDCINGIFIKYTVFISNFKCIRYKSRIRPNVVQSKYCDFLSLSTKLHGFSLSRVSTNVTVISSLINGKWNGKIGMDDLSQILS